MLDIFKKFIKQDPDNIYHLAGLSIIMTFVIIVLTIVI